MPIRTPTIELSSFFRLANESDPLDLVDIINDYADKTPASNADGYLHAKGQFVYECDFLLDENECNARQVEKVTFDFVVNETDGNEKNIASFSIPVTRQPVKNTEIGSTLGTSDPLKISAHSAVTALISLKTPEFENLSQIVSKVNSVSNLLPTAKNTFAATVASLEKQKIDPAKVLAPGKIVNNTPAFEMSPGLRNDKFEKPNNPNFARLGNTASSNSKSIAAIKAVNKQKAIGNPRFLDVFSNFLNLPPVTRSQSLVKDLPVVRVQVVPKWTTIRRQFLLDKTLMKDVTKLKMRVGASIPDRMNVIVNEVDYDINHTNEVADYLGNADPPDIIAADSLIGKISITLKRTDPLLRKVAVVRITKNPNSYFPVIEPRPSISFTDGNSVVYEDFVDNYKPNMVIYRFMTENEDGSLGGFNSYVVNQFEAPANKQRDFSAKTPISIRAINSQEGIAISVYVLTDDVFSIRLIRQELNAVGGIKNNCKTIYSPKNEYSVIVGNNKNYSLNFLDLETVPGRRYRYFAAYVIGTPGKSSMCEEMMSDEDDIITRIQPVDALPYVPSIEPPGTFASYQPPNSNNSGITYTIPLQLQDSSNDFNTLINSLRFAGIDAQFLAELQADKQKLRQAAVFLIERVNRISGRRERFGFYPPGKFFDSPEERAKSGVSDLMPGGIYEYVIKLCVRPPESFLQTAFKGFVARADTQGNTTQVLATRFQSAFRSLGILPSEREVRLGKSISENFESGQTGIEITAGPFFVSQPNVQILDVTIKPKRSYNLISWRAAGLVATIDFFTVHCVYNGNEEFLGTISSSGKGSYYLFRDERFAQEVGEKKYFVRAIGINSDKKTVAQSDSVLASVYTNVPPLALDGIVFFDSAGNKQANVRSSISSLLDENEPEEFEHSNASRETFVKTPNTTEFVRGENSNPTFQAISSQQSNSFGLINSSNISNSMATVSTVAAIAALVKSNPSGASAMKGSAGKGSLNKPHSKI